MNRVMLFVVAAFAALVIFNPFYIVQEYQRAVLLEFSAVKKTNIGPGLHLKIPVIQSVKKFDTRILTIDAEPERYLTVNNRKLIVDSFAQWKILDVDKFYRAANGSEAVATRELAKRIDSGLREQFGDRTVNEVISEQREELMDALVKKIDKEARADYGVELVDVRVKRIDLPREVNESVYKRMNADRNRLAQEKRSTGHEAAEERRAQADKEKEVLLAEAYREAEQTRGEGDAKAAAIYAEAYNRDPEFHAFLRSLNTYKQSFNDKDDLMILDSNSEFFKYLKSSR